MNTNPEPFYESSDNTLDRAIRAAIRQPPPEEVKRRVLQKAADMGTSDLRSRTLLGRMTWTKRAWLAGAAMAAVALAALIFFSLQPPSIAWSQVVEATRGVPWIHVKYAEGRSMEAWISFSRKIAAVRDSDSNTVHFDDYRSGVSYEYNIQQKKLYRLVTRDIPDFKAAEKTFEALLSGNGIREGEFLEGQIRVTKTRQRTVNEQGRRWIIYEFDVEPPEGVVKPAEAPTTSVEVRVNADDPGKFLPDSATLTSGKLKVTIGFDYPAEGPADIYALGVPRDAPLEDRTPPPDLKRILKIVEENRRNFGEYLAVAGRGGMIRLIRCKGGKFRVDIGMGEVKFVATASDLEKWWREHARETLPQGAILCDGRNVYNRDPGQPKQGWKPFAPVREGEGRTWAESFGNASGCLVDLVAYPGNLDLQSVAFSPQYTALLDAKGENGPAGSVRIEVQRAKSDNANDRNSYHREEYWLQPKYGYAVVKHVTSDCPVVDEDPQRKEKQIIHEYEGFLLTPHGIWYPTVSRWKNASYTENKNKPGGVEFHDQVTYFYLDFTAKLPDELFSTKYEGDLLTGIDLAPRDSKPSPSDLRAIRPPGGAPLNQFDSRGIASVEGIERARQRLESAPLKDTDQWIAELERITGTKPDPARWEEKQGWRTDFVVHMSVAFDGLRWNAKAAERLFQRAQNLPTAEAKAWKEAFEAVLKNQIERAYEVPLVLIPVDAVFDGQAYSIERAKKYRERLSQLSADDVSLWKDKVDEFGGTSLDAAMNIILLDDFFDHEKFQREKFRAAIAALKQ